MYIGADPAKIEAALAEVERFKQFDQLQKRQREAIELLDYLRQQTRELQSHVRTRVKRLGFQ